MKQSMASSYVYWLTTPNICEERTIPFSFMSYLGSQPKITLWFI